jgi:chromosome segregation ATPase
MPTNPSHTGDPMSADIDIDDNNGDDYRDNLLSALAALHEEQKRLNALQLGRDKAQQQRHALSDQVAEAEQQLSQARSEETSRLAFAFASGGMTATSPLSSAQRQLEHAKAATRSSTSRIPSTTKSANQSTDATAAKPAFTKRSVSLLFIQPNFAGCTAIAASTSMT